MIDKLWYRKSFLSCLLLPASALFCVLCALRRFLYRIKVLSQTKVDVPVIVIGNISVGGTGKTPLIIALVEYLKQQGFKPGVVSRGYGGHAQSYPCRVLVDSKAEAVGDEALMIARRTGCPVIVDPNRPRAALALQHECDVILSDDGMQHYALARDIEVAVVDSNRQFGNGWLLPAGPLREPVSRLHQVDFVIYNGHIGENGMQLRADKFINLKLPALRVGPEFFAGKTVHAIAGIGHPERFFKSLEQMGIPATIQAFPDHTNYVASDLPEGCIIMTEKDAVKCERFATDDMWYLPVTAELPAKLTQKIQEKLIA